MKKISLVLIILVNFSLAWSQNFSFQPDTIHRTLALDAFSIDQIDITPLYTNDTAYISYRLIENTCPAEWEFILCDWSDCFIDMPNTDAMHPLPNGYDALVKISTHPHGVEGSGHLQFWIFPTGQMAEHESIYFYYHTPNAMAIPQETLSALQYHWNDNELRIHNAPHGDWKLLDSSGRILSAGKSPTTEFSLFQTGITSGLYFMIWPDTGQLLKINALH
ncbi:MAG: hypothetical protein RLY35_1438 [Bacteroidota bacterium]|jgi:hypothetical protein